MSIRVGIVGARYIANLYGHAIRRTPGVEAVAVASPNTAEAFAWQHGIARHYKDYRAMIEDTELDAVAIGAPNDLHYDICVAAADAGKHVFCDKPLAMNMEEARGMVEVCRRAGVVLMYAENLLFAPLYERVHQLARSGSIGEPFLVKQTQSHGGPYSDWFWDIDRAGGGVLLDMGCHSIHTICWVVGTWPEAVTAVLGRYAHGEKTVAEDHAEVVLHFPGGAMGIAENSWAMPGGNDALEVYGPGGRYVADLERGPAIRAYVAPIDESAADPAGSRAGWQFQHYDELWQWGFPQEWQHFAEVLSGRAELRSSGEDGVRVLEIICAAYESARRGQRVDLPFTSSAERPVDHWLDGR
ncbi:MAG: Gfo/Idh/MocA family oxidoreductase [Dehalococcoidia bacterium]